MKDTEILKAIKQAYIDGYESGHNDTVESQYGCAEEKSGDWIEEYLIENLINSEGRMNDGK